MHVEQEPCDASKEVTKKNKNGAVTDDGRESVLGVTVNLPPPKMRRTSIQVRLNIYLTSL
jgi:hypothetical protein